MSRENLGYIRIPANRVADACRKVIGEIDQARSEQRKKWIKQELARKRRIWRIFTRWLGCQPPTEEDVVAAYNGSDEQDLDSHLFWYAKRRAQMLQIAAKALHDEDMWISVEAAAKIGV